VQYILSANHILARSDAATVGDAIVQPGLIDTQPAPPRGPPPLRIVPVLNLQANPSLNVDAAIAELSLES
jgi:hypothetical protein